jgi:hypothetical protein
MMAVAAIAVSMHLAAWRSLEHQRQLSRTRGTQVVPSATLNAHSRLVAAICTQFAEADPIPAERLAYFKDFEGPAVGVCGWYGSITGLEPSAGGAWLVTVRVGPHLIGTNAWTGHSATAPVESRSPSGGWPLSSADS